MELKTPEYPKFDKRRRERLRLALNPPVVIKGKRERALEAKDQKRREQKVGTIVTATKHTLLQARQLRDELESDPRFIERLERRMRSSSPQTMPWHMRQDIFKEIVDNALEGTPEGDIPDDGESSLVVLPENYLDEVCKEIDALLGPEGVKDAHNTVLRLLESEGEDEDGDENDSQDGSDEATTEGENDCD